MLATAPRAQPTTIRLLVALAIAIGSVVAVPAVAAADTATTSTSATTGTSTSAAAAADVVFWEGTWNTVKINTEIAAVILEHGYDMTVEQVDVSAAIMQQSLLNGEIDVNLELWCINREQYCEENFGENEPLTMLSPVYEDSTQGWYIPRYVVEGDQERGIDPIAPDLSSVDQLPQYADVFADPANPGQGRLLAGVTGWAITADNEVKLNAYGLDDTFNAQTVGSQAALDAAIVGAIQQGEPILAYYWTPTWIMGKYDMIRLEEPEWTEACEQARAEATSQGPPYAAVGDESACAFKTTNINPGVRSDLQERAPQVVELVDNMAVGLEPIAEAAAYMKDESVGARAAALHYMEQNPDRWKNWLPAEVAADVEAAISDEQDDGTSLLVDFPSSAMIPLEDWTETGTQWVIDTAGGFFGTISDGLTYAIARVQDFLLWIPWWVLVGAFAALGWYLRDWKLALGVAVGFALLGFLGVWEESMKTLALILFATAVSVAIGLPIGILAARNDRVDAVIRPVLDFMQTMPSFVYLVPAVILFSIGQVPALIATVIYATPPVVRLTNLGIRQVPEDAVEAARAFGSTPRQTLRKVQLPLAFPTIMAGVNQTVMLALAMVVIASLVGAEGLGRPVLEGLQNLNVGLAFVGGLGIVILAMIIDRLTQAAGRGDQEQSA